MDKLQARSSAISSLNNVVNTVNLESFKYFLHGSSHVAVARSRISSEKLEPRNLWTQTHSVASEQIEVKRYLLFL